MSSPSVTILFPGQGSQYVGMAKDIADKKYFKYIELADSILDIPLLKTMLEGPEDKLKLTTFAQPAIIAYSVALFTKTKETLDKNNIPITRVLGHSVGEYSALVAAGSLKYEDAIALSYYRGKFMQEAVKYGEGKMLAVIKRDTKLEEIKKICQMVSSKDQLVSIANFNDPTQVVISGYANACDDASKLLKEINYKTIELKVSAPFHCPLMKPAADKLKHKLDATNIMPNTTCYIANVDAKEYPKGTDAKIIRENLYKQVSSSVLWLQSINKISDETTFIEVGPKSTLKAMMKKTNPACKMISVEKDDILEFIEEIKCVPFSQT